MKSQILFFLLCVSFIACKTTKDSTSDVIQAPEVTDNPPIVMESQAAQMSTQATMSLTIIEYYTAKIVNGKTTLTRHEKAGQSVLRLDGENKLMDVLLDSGEKFTCKQQKHPETNIDIYVQIGGTTPENEH